MDLLGWLFTIVQCERKTLSTTINQTSFDNFDKCIELYSSKGLPYLIEFFSTGFQWTLTWLVDHQITTCFIGYGAFHQQSDAYRTIVDVSNVIRQDSSAAFNEIWSSIKNGFIALYQTMTVVKIIEIIVIDLFLKGAPDLLDFVSKTLGKVAKV